MFNVQKVTSDIIQWIRDWFDVNGQGCNAVIGISGGKDSSVTAALCAAAVTYSSDLTLGDFTPSLTSRSLTNTSKTASPR